MKGENESHAVEYVDAGSSLSPENVYPVTLINLRGAPVVVVGGGRVAKRKIGGLLTVGARVTVVSPKASRQVRTWSEDGKLAWLQRPYRSADLADARLAFAATDVRAVNARVARDAAKRGVWCNVADAPEEGDFHVPAVYRGEDIVLAVSSAGRNPRRAQLVRDRMAAILEETGDER